VDECKPLSDGTRLASASMDGTVRMWNVNTWREVGRLEGHDGAVCCCVWSPDGTQLASAAGMKVHVWDVLTGLKAGAYTHPLLSAT